MLRRRLENSHPRETHGLTELVLHACLVASDAAFNIREFLANSSQMAFLAVRDCEKEKMLQQVREGFSQRELDPASYVLRADREIDRVYRSLFRRQLQSDRSTKMQHRADLLLMAQALERAGDHATNMAEELFRLIEGRSLRHMPKKRVKD